MSSRGINFLGDKKQTSVTPETKKLRTLRLIAVGLLFIISTASIILFLFIGLSPLPTVQKQEQNALRTLSAYHPDMAKLYFLNERLMIAGAVLDKRKNFDNTLEEVVKEMPKEVSLEGLSIKDKNITVTVRSGSLLAIKGFLDNLTILANEEKKFSNITLTSLVVNQQQNTFTLIVSLTTL